MQRAVSKFTQKRAKELAGVRDLAGLSEKQVEALESLFREKIWMVFLPRTQSIAPPSWMDKFVRIKDNGDREIKCKRGRHQLLQMEFQPHQTEHGPDYIQGGDFFIAGPQIPSSQVRCMALQASGSEAPQWRLENYDVDDVDEPDEEEAADEGTSAEEDERLHQPAGFQNFVPDHDQSGSEIEIVEGEEEEVLEVWGWQAEAMETKPQDIHETPAILRPRGKHSAEEWKLLDEEGWMEKLPCVPGTTLSKHKKQNAWSTKYGNWHFARHATESRSPLLALLLCMAWLVEQHFNHCPSDELAALHQQLLARISLEDSF